MNHLSMAMAIDSIYEAVCVSYVSVDLCLSALLCVCVCVLMYALDTHVNSQMATTKFSRNFHTQPEPNQNAVQIRNIVNVHSAKEEEEMKKTKLKIYGKIIK